MFDQGILFFSLFHLRFKLHLIDKFLQVVNGKEVQIQLTGFMEKNTGKFMKELWTLLLSAQKNTSGVPQQFLDAKQEETRKRKVSVHLRITLWFYPVCT